MKWLQKGLVQHLGLWILKLLLGESMGTCFKHGKRFLNRRFQGTKWGNLFKCLWGKEGETTWMVGRRRGVCQHKRWHYGDGFCLPPSLSLLSLQLGTLSLHSVPHHTTTAHLSPSCSSVTVSILPVTQQLIALSMLPMKKKQQEQMNSSAPKSSFPVLVFQYKERGRWEKHDFS